MQSLTNNGQQPDHKILLQHVSDDDIAGNASFHSHSDHDSELSTSELDGLNSEVTEMEKIRSVGKGNILIDLHMFQFSILSTFTPIIRNKIYPVTFLKFIIVWPEEEYIV